MRRPTTALIYTHLPHVAIVGSKGRKRSGRLVVCPDCNAQRAVLEQNLLRAISFRCHACAAAVVRAKQALVFAAKQQQKEERTAAREVLRLKIAKKFT